MAGGTKDRCRVEQGSALSIVMGLQYIGKGICYRPTLRVTFTAIDLVRSGYHGLGLHQSGARGVLYGDQGHLVGIFGGSPVIYRGQGNAVGLEMILDQLYGSGQSTKAY